MFPAVFFQATNKEVLQFELGRTKVITWSYKELSLIDSPDPISVPFCRADSLNTLFRASLLFQSALPLSAVLFRGGKHVIPQCPPRLDLQYLSPFQWSRVPISSNKVHTLKLSEIRGWSMLCEEAGKFLGESEI